MGARGSPVSNIDVGATETVTCTFVNARGYPRPKGAALVVASLVPAYRECTAADSVHGPPLADPSCTNPTLRSSALTVGTPDSNGKQAQSEGRVRLDVATGNPGTTADEADVAVRASITDVRNASDLSDYLGALQAKVDVRITDRNNGPDAIEAGTAEDIPLAFTVPCTATATDLGARCAVTTSVEAITPGAISEGDRSVWELGQVQLLDAQDNPFVVQGIFVP